MNINELLDELQTQSYIEGLFSEKYQSTDDPLLMEKFQNGMFKYLRLREEARAAVDAEVKRMQDRIAELEREAKVRKILDRVLFMGDGSGGLSNILKRR